MKYDFGDKVKIMADKDYKGILVQSSDKDTTIVKLDSGYNVGIENKKIKNILLIEKTNAKKIESGKVITRKNLPTISILHTGGTIASKVDYKTGAVAAKFKPEELQAMFPELADIANIKSRLIGNMMSENMRFKHYNIIAKEIDKEIKDGTDGVIITHGTDTLHYTSAALSFMLENLPIPVMLVGSQRSSDRGSSDAAMNLINAVYFVSKSDFAEVALCMHNSSEDNYCAILPGTKARKMHASRRDAFKTINTSPIALVDYKKDEIKLLNKTYNKKSKSKIIIKPFKENLRIGILKQYTNMYDDEFLFYKKYDGLVIEATGLGNLPISEDDYSNENKKIFDALKQLTKNTVIVLSPQTIFGRLNLNVYENARRQQDIGILGNDNDMTTETTYIKLAWLLSNYKKEEAKRLILTNLRGELSKRTEFEEEFV